MSDTPDTGLVHTDDTPLETGWSSSTPDGDGIVLDASRAMGAAYTEIARAGGHRHASHPDLGLEMGDGGAPTPFANTAHLSAPMASLGDGATERVVETVREFFDGGPGGPYLIFSTHPTGDLRGLGLSPVGHPPLMACWTAVPTPPHPELTIRRATTLAGLRDFERTLIEGYPIAEMWPYVEGSFLAEPVLRSSWQFHVGYVDDEPVACAAGFRSEAVTLIEMVATRPEARGRGYGAALTAAAMGDVSDRPAVLIASDDGQNVYAALGFRRILRFTLWVGTRRS